MKETNIKVLQALTNDTHLDLDHFEASASKKDSFSNFFL